MFAGEGQRGVKWTRGLGDESGKAVGAVQVGPYILGYRIYTISTIY